MAQPLAVPFFSHTPSNSTLPAAYVVRPLSAMASEGDIVMHEPDPLKGSLRIDECDDEDEIEFKPRPAKRSRVAFQCDECGTSYTEKRALARHRHTDQHRRKLGLPPNKKHSCSVCGKLFGRGHDLKRHYNEQHPNEAGRTGGTPGSTHSGEPSSSSSEFGSEHGLSIDHAARSTASPTTAPRSSCSLPDEKPAVLPYSMNSPEHPPTIFNGVVRRIRTMSDLKIEHSSPTVPVIRMNQIDKMDVMDDVSGPTICDPRRLRPSSSMGSIAQRSEASSSRFSEYSTDHSIKTATTDSVPDLHPYMPTPVIPRQDILDFSTPPKPNDDSAQPMACVMCGIAFEDDPDELLEHLRRHLDIFKGEYRCNECFVGFVHSEDLISHKHAAAKGHCGFNFPHIKPCTGHHPPSKSAWVDHMPDSDSFRLCNKLRHWEQSQLHAYVSEINNLVASRKNRKFERWSVGTLMRGSRTSFRSMAISVNTYASAPCDMDENDRHDIGGLQQRLRQMSLKKASTSLKSMIKKQRIPSSIPEHPPGTLNKQLQHAISRGNLSRAERLVREGSQRSALQHANATVTTEALWGHHYIASRIAEHRIQENLTGTCSVCRISNTAFESGLGKIKMLLAHGAEVNQPGGLCGYPINTAAWMGKADVVKLLLQRRARVDSVGEEYGTPLCTAAAQADNLASFRVIQVLLDYRADVHWRGSKGTALELAKGIRNELSLEASSGKSSKDDIPLRFAYCEDVIGVLDEAERCRSPPLVGTLYCHDASMMEEGGPGVATFKSYRPPALMAG